MSSRRSASAGGGKPPSPKTTTTTTTAFSLVNASREYEIGMSHLDHGNPETAVRHLQLALTSMKQAGSPDHALLANVMLALGNAYGAVGNSIEARSYFQWCHDLMARQEGDDFVGLASPLLNIGILCCKDKDYAQALHALKDAQKRLENVFGADRVLLADTYHNLGVAYDGLHRIPMALQCYAKAIRIREHFSAEQGQQGSNSSRIALSMENVALCWRAQGNHNEALKLITKVLGIRRKNPGAGTVEYAQALLSAGVIGLDMRKHNFAVTHLEAAGKLFTTLVGHDHRLTRQCERLLAGALGGADTNSRLESPRRPPVIAAAVAPAQIHIDPTRFRDVSPPTVRGPYEYR